jgi:large subunit ribosomal protein L35
MPKAKTRKLITKRFRITKNKKVLRRQGFKGHLNVKKSAKRKRRLSRVIETNSTYAKKILKVLGL